MLSGAEALKIIRFAASAADGRTASASQSGRAPRHSGTELLPWVVTAILVVAGASYWIGVQSVGAGPPSNRRVTVALPKSPTPVRQAGMPQTLQPTPHPTGRSGPAPAIPSPVLRAEQTRISDEAGRAEGVAVARPAAGVTQRQPKSTETAANAKPVASPPKVATSPHQVRIGRFATAAEAEKEWSKILRQWPEMHDLQSATVPIQSLRDGRTYYRVQIGTTSRAHSEVVCQHAHEMDQSCTIIGSDEPRGESAF